MSYFDEERQFPKGDCSESDFYKVFCPEIVENDVILLEGKPCKIVENSTDKPNEYGLPTRNLIGINIFTNEKCRDRYAVTQNAIVLNVLETEYQLLDVSDDGFVSLLDETTNKTREDVKLPTGDIGKQIKEKLNSDETIKVTVVKCIGEEHIVSYKLEN